LGSSDINAPTMSPEQQQMRIDVAARWAGPPGTPPPGIMGITG
jgi:hypothetical protein